MVKYTAGQWLVIMYVLVFAVYILCYVVMDNVRGAYEETYGKNTEEHAGIESAVKVIGLGIYLHVLAGLSILMICGTSYAMSKLGVFRFIDKHVEVEE